MFFQAITAADSRDPLLDEKLPAVSDAVRRALRVCGMSDKQAAHTMGISESQFSRQLNTCGINSVRIAMLPPEFQRVYLPLLAQASNVTVPGLETTEARLSRLEREVAELRAEKAATYR